MLYEICVRILMRLGFSTMTDPNFAILEMGQKSTPILPVSLTNSLNKVRYGTIPYG